MLKKWEKFEKKLASEFGGRRTKASGNQWDMPGDIKSDKWLIEAKQTEKKSYSLKKETLDKIYEEALFSHRIPLMALSIDGMEVMVTFKEDFLKLLA